jgi:hypothetical protein
MDRTMMQIKFLVLVSVLFFLSCNKDCDFNDEINAVSQEEFQSAQYAYAIKNGIENWTSSLATIQQVDLKSDSVWYAFRFTSFDNETQSLMRDDIAIFFQRSQFKEGQQIELTSIGIGNLPYVNLSTASYNKFIGDEEFKSSYEIRKNCEISYVIIDKITDTFVEGRFEIIFEVMDIFRPDEEEIETKYSQGFFRAAVN